MERAITTLVDVGEVSSIFTFSSRFTKTSPKTPPKKSSPTTLVTETSILHVLDPPDHFGTIYIFDHFFTYIHNLDLVFFQQILPEKVKSPELAAYSYSAADSPKRVRIQKHAPKKLESSPTTFFGESAAKCEFAANFTDLLSCTYDCTF